MGALSSEGGGGGTEREGEGQVDSPQSAEPVLGLDPTM